MIWHWVREHNAHRANAPERPRPRNTHPWHPRPAAEDRAGPAVATPDSPPEPKPGSRRVQRAAFAAGACHVFRGAR